MKLRSQGRNTSRSINCALNLENKVYLVFSKFKNFVLSNSFLFSGLTSYVRVCAMPFITQAAVIGFESVCNDVGIVTTQPALSEVKLRYTKKISDSSVPLKLEIKHWYYQLLVSCWYPYGLYYRKLVRNCRIVIGRSRLILARYWWIAITSSGQVYIRVNHFYSCSN